MLCVCNAVNRQHFVSLNGTLVRLAVCSTSPPMREVEQGIKASHTGTSILFTYLGATVLYCFSNLHVVVGRE